MSEATVLRRFREELGVSQDTLVRRTKSINLRTYVRAEQGKQSVKYTTAMEILEAVNAIRSEQGKEALSLNDLGLTIY